MTVHPALVLDPVTVKVMTLVTLLAISAVALLACRLNRQVVGLRWFACGLLLIGAGGLLGLVRLWNEGPSILAACNVAMFAGFVTVAQGIRIFRNFRPVPWSVFAILAAVVAPLFLYWLLGHDLLSMRVGLMSAVFCILSADASASMFRRVAASQRSIYWPAGITFGFVALYNGARSLGGFAGFYGHDVFSAIPLEMATTICSNIALIVSVVSMLLAANAQLQHDARRLALFDPLTNLPNRRYFLERLLESERRSLVEGTRFGLVYLDLDGFKAVNDTLGHAVGDNLLRSVSAAMSGVMRAGDCLARVGGDEFVAIAEHVHSPSDLNVLSDRLKRAVATQSSANDFPLPVRISSGCAVFPDDGRTGEAVLREADDAMYREKHGNPHRNRMALAV
jgi:diguanylate cyclase (GGDEF)-like protein